MDTTQIFVVLFQLAVSLSGLSAPEEVEIPKTYFYGQHMMPDNGNAHYTNEGKIYLPKPCTESVFRTKFKLGITCRGVWLHEAVHHVQEKNGQLNWHNDSCRNRFMNEQQAYKIQYKYLTASGLNRSEPKKIVYFPLDCSRISSTGAVSYWGVNIK